MRPRAGARRGNSVDAWVPRSRPPRTLSPMPRDLFPLFGTKLPPRPIVLAIACLTTACIRIGPAPASASQGSADATPVQMHEELELPSSGPGSNRSVEYPAVFLDHVYLSLDSVTYPDTASPPPR